MRYLVLADDLTGAGDTAIALAGPDALADVYLDMLSSSAMDACDGSERPPVVAVDLHTRGLPVDEACRRVVQATAQAPAGVTLYKKIDSTLRGHIGAELAALCDGLAGRGAAPVVCIVAPAFPAMGRTLERGALRMDGKPVDAAALWGAGAPPTRGDIAAELREHGYTCLSLYLDDIRAGQESELAARMTPILTSLDPALRAMSGRGVPLPDDGNAPPGARLAVVCDASCMDDLRRIVRAARLLTARCVWVGSAGLAHALADVDAQDAKAVSAAGAPQIRHADSRPGQRPMAFVVGSFSAVAAEQVRVLAQEAEVVHVALPADELVDATGAIEAATARHIEDQLVAGRDLVLSISRQKIRPELAQRLSAGMASFAQAMLPRLDALVCCGGDTSRALLDRIGARRLTVRGCGEPGVTLVRCDVQPGMPFIMKAGAFGDPQALLRLRRQFKAASHGPHAIPCACPAHQSQTLT
jgi:4-hydroxythreonine-4-phosphate dehydrogenase